MSVPMPVQLHLEGAASVPSLCSSDRTEAITNDGAPCYDDPVLAETECIKAILLNDQEKVPPPPHLCNVLSSPLLSLSVPLVTRTESSLLSPCCSRSPIELLELLRQLQELDLAFDTLDVSHRCHHNPFMMY